MKRNDPLAWLPPDRLVFEDDLDLSIKEVVKAVIGWTVIFGCSIAFIFIAAFSGIQ